MGKYNVSNDHRFKYYAKVGFILAMIQHLPFTILQNGSADINAGPQ